jgi:hypothetical protein
VHDVRQQSLMKDDVSSRGVNWKMKKVKKFTQYNQWVQAWGSILVLHNLLIYGTVSTFFEESFVTIRLPTLGNARIPS